MRKTITLHVRDCTFFGSLSSLHYYGEISLDIDPQSRHLAIVWYGIWEKYSERQKMK